LSVAACAAEVVCSGRTRDPLRPLLRESDEEVTPNTKRFAITERLRI